VHTGTSRAEGYGCTLAQKLFNGYSGVGHEGMIQQEERDSKP
jgi:hypothetical protein